MSTKSLRFAGSGRVESHRSRAATRKILGAASPIELTALAEDDADVSAVLLAVLVRNDPCDFQAPRRRHQDAREHLDRRRFSGAVRPDVADQFARGERHRDVGHGNAVFVFAREERAQRAEPPEARLTVRKTLRRSRV